MIQVKFENKLLSESKTANTFDETVFIPPYFYRFKAILFIAPFVLKLKFRIAFGEYFFGYLNYSSFSSIPFNNNSSFECIFRIKLFRARSIFPSHVLFVYVFTGSRKL